MLNTIAYRGSGGDGFVWQPNRVKLDPDPANRTDMLSILAFARAHDTLRSASRGSDPHGWRNALNAYGWGEEAMTDPALRVYDDREYRTFRRCRPRRRQVDRPLGRCPSASSAGPAATRR